MDKYQRIKKIGEGSFGTALLVRSKENGKQMVVKEINMSKMGDKERKEARKETAVLAQLNHPNIVHYRESFEEVGNLYIVMDYCDGGDLYSRINQCRGILMGEDMILDWFVQICLSIKHIHDRKILHRDIKSQNIFLTKHGIVKLGDFGIAKVLNSTVELARTCIGTPYYLSPEIVENKPYNNKSDIWSLGCVLYEMTTLKHAFEAGNMKNLVLKIIRGSYPPVSPQYSYDIRNLIALLFKRNARDRPSINAVLRKPLLQNRIKKFLTENEYCDEFSHTIMHGQKIQKALPVGQRHVAPVRAVSSAAKKPPATPRYNPASVYAPSVARRSREVAPKVRKSSDAPRKSSDSGAARKSQEAKRIVGGVNSAQSELAKRRQELVQKEKARQEAAKLREQQYAKQHKELQDRQKMARMAKAREEGWKNLLDSDESVSSNRKAPSPKRDEPRRVSDSPIPSKPSVQAAAAGGKDRGGQYEHYHAYLDKLDQDRKAALRPTPQEPPGAHGAGAPVGGVAAALGGAAYGGAEAARAAQYGDAAGARGADAAKRAKILEEYLYRKREAAMNKARGVSEVHGAARPSSARPANDGAAAASAAAAARAGRPVSAREAHRKQQEDEYMSRLKQIRLNNFNERRMQENEPAQKPPAGPIDPHDQRRKKIEALRAQADDRARRLKAELEKKRRVAYDLEQQRLQAMARARPAPPVPMTDAMRAIGAAPMSPPVIPTGGKPPIGMTAAMEAIGVAGQGSPGVPDKDKSPLQKKKEEILKRLNSKPKEKVVKKWGEPVEPLAERPQWCEAGESGALSNMKLEETASHMEATNANDGVTRYDKPVEEDPPSSARRRWGGRAGTVLNLLQGADLAGDDSDGNAALSASGSSEAPTPSPRSPIVGPGKSIGTTITLSKKGTQVLARASLPVVSENKGPVTEAVRASVPVSVPMKADAPKKLFDKVEFDEDEDDATRDQDDVVLQDIEDQEEGKVSARIVKTGLQTGQFDVGNVKMLRTCSEPDLSKLFRTTLADNPFFKEQSDVHASLELRTPSEDDEDDDNDNDDDNDDEAQEVEEEIEDSQDIEAEGQSEGREGDDEDDGSAGDDDDEDEDEDDLQTVRESMMSLLADDDDDEDNKDTEKTLTPTSDKKKVKKSKKLKSRFKKKKGRRINDVESSGEGDTSTGSNMMRSESAEDFVSMRATMRDVLASIKVGPPKKHKENKETPAQTSSGAGDGQSKDEPDTPSSIEPGRESWESDEDDDDFFEDDEDDMFSRLEEKRVCLEQDLGCDTFIKAYKTVQKFQREKAIHEDEDENMEEGIRLVSQILGDDKAHLYPAILQLVMADGVFMEDNC